MTLRYTLVNKNLFCDSCIPVSTRNSSNYLRFPCRMSLKSFVKKACYCNVLNGFNPEIICSCRGLKKTMRKTQLQSTIDFWTTQNHSWCLSFSTNEGFGWWKCFLFANQILSVTLFHIYNSFRINRYHIYIFFNCCKAHFVTKSLR